MRIGKYMGSDGAAGTAVTFLLIGLGVGAALGLLLAPKSGRQLRKDLRRSYDDALETVSDWTDEAKGRFEEAVEKVPILLRTEGQSRTAERLAAPFVSCSRWSLVVRRSRTLRWEWPCSANRVLPATNDWRPTTPLRFDLSLVFERALLLVHIANDNAHQEAEVVLLLLRESGKLEAV